MVWGCFVSSGQLAIKASTMNSTPYQSALDGIARPCTKKDDVKMEHAELYQQIHQGVAKKKKSRVMDLPSQTHDLNPFKMLCV